MELKLVMKSARSAVIEIADGGIYSTKEKYQIFVNHVFVKETETVITSLYDLKPETSYEVVIKGSSEEEKLSFTTDYEFVTLNVKEFGAKGDGVQDDTHFIQTAILACPENSRVLIPAGVYRITSSTYCVVKHGLSDFYFVSLKSLSKALTTKLFLILFN